MMLFMGLCVWAGVGRAQDSGSYIPRSGGELEQLISAPTVQFKGAGWYVTDYARKGSGGGSSSGGAPRDGISGSDSNAKGSSDKGSGDTGTSSSGSPSSDTSKPGSSPKNENK